MVKKKGGEDWLPSFFGDGGEAEDWRSGGRNERRERDESLLLGDPG